VLPGGPCGVGDDLQTPYRLLGHAGEDSHLGVVAGHAFLSWATNSPLRHRLIGAARDALSS
jgi:hypothetical protein